MVASAAGTIEILLLFEVIMLDLHAKLINDFLVVIRPLPSSDDVAPLRHLLLRRDLIPVAHLHGDQQVLDQEADLQVDEGHLR